MSGLAVHRAARISAAGHGGQILLSGSTRDVVEDDLPSGQRLRDLGEHRLKDLPRPERVFQLVGPGLASDFPPLKSLEEQADLVPAAAQPWWRRAKVLGPLAGTAAAVVAAGALLLHGGDEAGATGLPSNALGLIDAGSGDIEGEIAVDAAPTGVARGEGAVWVTNANDGTVSRIDPVGRSVRQTIGVGNSPSGIAVGADAVWVANHADATVSRIAPETNAVVQTIEVGSGPIAVAFGEGSVWVTNSNDRTVSRIDPESGRVVATIKTDAVGRGIAAGAGSIWITDESSRRVMRIDPLADEVAEEISVGNGPTGIAVGGRAVWVANTIDGTVSRIDAAESRVTATIAVSGGPGAVAASGGRLWVSVEFAERLVRIDPVQGTVVDAVSIGNRPKGVVVSDEGVWVAVQASGRGHRGGRLIVQSEALDSIDPAIANVPFSAQALSLVYDGLTGFRRIGGSEGTQPLPNLAASIPSPRDGGKTYAFRLRPGIRYANGRIVQPEDFRRALERTYALGGPRAEEGNFAPVVGTERCESDRPCDLSVDDEQAFSAVVEGKADVLLRTIPGKLSEVKARYARQLRTVPERATVFLFLDTKQPPFDDIRVRRALNYAIDRRRVVELQEGLAQSTCQVIQPTVPGYVRYCPYTLDPRPSGEWTAPDPAKARRLIAASGTAAQKVTVWTFSFFGKQGRYVVSLLRGLGYRARLRELKEISPYFATIADPKTKAQSGIAGWYGGRLGGDFVGTLSCDFDGNWARFCDRGIDRQIEDALKLLATDTGAAATTWSRIDRQLVDQAPWVPLFNPRTPYLLSKRVGNWQYHPYHSILLDQLWVR